MSETDLQTPSLPYQNKGNLTQGSVRGHLVRLAVPMTWGIMAIISFQLVNTFWISFLGTEKLAAISFTFPLTYLIFSFSMGFAIAMSSVVSRLIGEGKKETIKRVVSQGIILVFGLSMLIAALGITFHDPIFRLMGADEAMLPLIGDYMNIWFAGMVFISLPMAGNAAIRAAGDSFTPALIMTVAAIANALLDPVLIFGLFGFPRLELQGAAIANVIINAGVLVAGLYVLATREKFLSFRAIFDHLSDFADSAKRLFSIALPVGLANAIQPAVNTLILALLANYGTAAVAAYGVVTRVEAFAFIILMGLATGMAPIVGQNWGAKNYPRVHEVLKLAIGFSAIWSVAIALILGIFAKPIAEAFSADPQVISYAALFFWVVPFSYIFANLIRGWASAFNAIGKPQYSFAIVIVEMLVLMVPAVIIGERIGGVAGIFIAMAAVNVAAGLAAHLWSWHSFLKKETTR